MSARRRARRDVVMRWVVTAAGLTSVLALLGIFALLVWNATAAVGGGVEAAPLTNDERHTLPPEVVRALDTQRAEPPSVRAFAGTRWAPAGTAPTYGLAPLLAGSLLTSALAMALAVPLGLGAAAVLAFWAKGRVRDLGRLAVELLAALPSVVVGFVGLEVTGPWLGRWVGRPGGLSASNGALLLAVMALPTIVSIAADALRSVPGALLDGARALGADELRVVTTVAFPAARSGVVAACLLGLGRAVGETMTVLLATGNVALLPHSVMDPVRTLTATIALEVGEVAAGSTHYHALFVVGLALFLSTLAINVAAGRLVRSPA